MTKKSQFSSKKIIFAHVMTIIVSITWAIIAVTNGMAIKDDGFNPFIFALGRFVGATIVTGILSVSMPSQRFWKPKNAKETASLSMYALTTGFLGQVPAMASFLFIDSGKFSCISALSPAVCMAIPMMPWPCKSFHIERFTWPRLACIFVALLGGYFIVLPEIRAVLGGSSGGDTSFDSKVILGVLLASVNVITKGFARIAQTQCSEMPAFGASIYVNLSGIILTSFTTIPYWKNFHPSQFTYKGWMGLAISCLGGSCFGFITSTMLAGIVSPMFNAAYMSLQPIATSLIRYLFLGMPIPNNELIGVSICLAAMGILIYDYRQLEKGKGKVSEKDIKNITRESVGKKDKKNEEPPRKSRSKRSASGNDNV